MSERMMRSLPKTDRTALNRLIEAARKLPPMTKEQRAAQRKSWVIGEMMLARPEMTREEAERIYDEVSD